ncbi:hypothetical protein E2562_027819 [Oryza meyeriana var. granulata]|uniref:Uncharacterized protein n=1 Tax=Oryza meyeriana var. granulata TaxID=110450 RepID=A0A6G1DN43_9ORYZ|nr:hypothetical protein E2562_027819 [Oryza meyeriana var. granulata]
MATDGGRRTAGRQHGLIMSWPCFFMKPVVNCSYKTEEHPWTVVVSPLAGPMTGIDLDRSNATRPQREDT